MSCVYLAAAEHQCYIFSGCDIWLTESIYSVIKLIFVLIDFFLAVDSVDES